MDRQVLKDRVAIVTGAARGLGEGIARAMAGEGATTVLFSRDLPRLQKQAEDFRGSGQKAVPFKVDVTDANQVNEAVREVLKQFGKVDILVNNAGTAIPMMFMEMSDEVRNDTINVNLIGVWSCTRAVLPGMIKQKYGRIINVSSVTGPMVGNKKMTAYSASKGAVSAFTKALALEVAEHNISVNAICPGFFDTPLVRGLAKQRGWDEPGDYVRELGKTVPMGRLGSIDDMGNLVVFLASEASSYITGTEIVIDGGNIIQEFKSGVIRK